MLQVNVEILIEQSYYADYESVNTATAVQVAVTAEKDVIRYMGIVLSLNRLSHRDHLRLPATLRVLQRHHRFPSQKMLDAAVSMTLRPRV
jgi:hypothetical protein